MELFLRDVEPKDMELLFQWANEPTVRQNSFQTEPIPFENHRQWFVKMLANRDILQFILCGRERGKEIEIGQIRLTIEGEYAQIGYSLDKEYRGQGYGTKIILMAEEKLRELRNDVKYALGEVKPENAASARVFVKCGYDVEKKPNYLEFIKRMK